VRSTESPYATIKERRATTRCFGSSGPVATSRDPQCCYYRRGRLSARVDADLSRAGDRERVRAPASRLFVAAALSTTGRRPHGLSLHQESLTNAIRHAQAQHVGHRSRRDHWWPTRRRTRRPATQLKLTVRDDGSASIPAPRSASAFRHAGTRAGARRRLYRRGRKRSRHLRAHRDPGAKHGGRPGDSIGGAA